MSVKILHGDCVEVMATLAEASVDAIVTDPPYHLTNSGGGPHGKGIDNPFSRARAGAGSTGFMGMAWDGVDVPPLDAGLGHWLAGFADGEGCFTTRRSGAGYVCEFVIHLRADDAAILRAVHTATGIGDIRGPSARSDGGNPMVKWVVSRQTDCARLVQLFEAFPLRAKKARDFEIWRSAVQEWIRHEPGTSWESLAQHAQMLSAVKLYGAAFNASQFFHYQWAKAAFRVLKPGGHLVAFGGTRTYHRLAAGIEDAGFEIRDQLGWIYGSGFPKSKNLDGDWAGWGTALKPAWEPIVLARKPMRGTVAANVALHGTGALNIDGCRVPTDGPREWREARRNQDSDDARNAYGKGLAGSVAVEDTTVGRWPANVLHDGSDEVLAAFPEAPGQVAPVKYDAEERKTGNVYGVMNRGHEPSADSDNQGAVGFKMKPGARRLDSGSAARFFYCAKADKSDRNEGLGERGNHHPTVKPTNLMRWLCRLITPPGGLVLDPFMGSGSTLKAAELEGFSAIGIELDPAYIEIAKRRIAADAPLFAEVSAA